MIFQKTNGSLYIIQHIIILMLNGVSVKMAHNVGAVGDVPLQRTKFHTRTILWHIANRLL
jgi:hypothetical protein